MVKKQDVIDLYEDIFQMEIPQPDDTLIGNALALGHSQMRLKVLNLIKRRFA